MDGLENMTHTKLQRVGIEKAAVLAGSVKNLHSHSAMARKKFSNYLQFVPLWPEYRHYFNGDSGQGDVELGVMMRTAPGATGDCALVTIHDVSNPPTKATSARAFSSFLLSYSSLISLLQIVVDGKAKTGADERAALLERGILLYDSIITGTVPPSFPLCDSI